MRQSVHIHGKESDQPRTRVVIHKEQDHLNSRSNVEIKGEEGVVADLGDSMKTRVQIHGGNAPTKESGPYQGRDVLQTRVVIEPTDVTAPSVTMAPLPAKPMSTEQAIEVLKKQLKEAIDRHHAAGNQIEQITAALSQADEAAQLDEDTSKTIDKIVEVTEAKALSHLQRESPPAPEAIPEAAQTEPGISVTAELVIEGEDDERLFSNTEPSPESSD